MTDVSDPKVASETKRLADALEAFTTHRFVRVHNSLPQLVFYQFLRGLAFGFGTVVGASLLVSIVALLLAQVEFVPILGDLATRVIQEIEAAR